MGKTKGGLELTIHLDGKLVRALNAWIRRHEPPHMSKEEAVRQVLAGRLASDHPSTQLPGFATGRDLV